MVPDVGQGLGGSRHSRVYRGLSAGPGDFLPFGCHHPVNLVFPVLPEGALTRARDIGSRRSPLTFDRPLLAEEGLRRYRCFRVSPGGSAFPRSWSPMTPRWLSSAFGGFRPSSSFLLVYQREAGFLQGLTLSPRVPPSQEGFDGSPVLFPFTDQCRTHWTGNTMKFAYPRLRMFPFQGFPQLPFPSRFTSRRGVLAVAFPFCAGALRIDFLPRVTPRFLSIRSVSPVYRQEDLFPWPQPTQGGS